MQQVQTPVSCLFIASRDQYSACQIQVPDLERPIAAIAIGNRYYSFFRLVQESHRALSMMTRLSYCGDRVAIKKNPKGYGIWVEEPEASPRSTRSTSSNEDNVAPMPAQSKVLIPTNQCKELQVIVPDLDQPVEAIAYDGKYYSLFRTEPDADKVIDIIAKISLRGDETVTFKTVDGYAICIVEPDAVPFNSGSELPIRSLKINA